MKNFIKKYFVEIILSLIMFTGFCLILYPPVSDWWNSLHQIHVIASYVEKVDGVSEEERRIMREAAEAYNERLANQRTEFDLTKEERTEYNALMDVTGTGVMGYIEIPVIDVDLPVYHGDNEAILQIAAGHIPGSSLPTGGAGTHSLITGHRGLPSATLFTDLDQLKEGDLFMLHVLGETLTYEVDRIMIVLPEEVDTLAIADGEDLCTLITCTPYGINTHRILVRGHRVANVRKEEAAVRRDAVRYPVWIVIPAMMLLIVFPVWIIQRIGIRIKRSKKSKEEMLEDLKKE